MIHYLVYVFDKVTDFNQKRSMLSYCVMQIASSPFVEIGNVNTHPAVAPCEV